MSPTVPSPSTLVRPDFMDDIGKLNVVIRMLGDHDCREDDKSEDSTGGFDLHVMRETLTAVRDHLRAVDDGDAK